MISVSDVQSKIPDKFALYGALVRNRRLMPPRKDAINTNKFMRGVWTKKYWVMSSEDVVALKMCADPPSRKAIAKILADIMTNYRSLGEPTDSGMKRTAKQIRKRPPSPTWLLMVLSNLDPENALFAKGYVAPKKPKGAENVFISNADDFFSGLPLAATKKKRYINLLDSKAKNSQQYSRLQAKIEKMQARLSQQQAAMNEESESSSSEESDSDSEGNASSQPPIEAVDEPMQMEAQQIRTGPNVIGNDDENDMSLPVMTNLSLAPKSDMKTRSAYKGNAFVNAGVKRTTDLPM